MSTLRIVVIGGGAAGFFGAIACAEAYPQAQVTLLEAGRQLLTKVRVSGGGRCNVTHACFDPALLVQHYPREAKPCGVLLANSSHATPLSGLPPTASS